MKRTIQLLWSILLLATPQLAGAQSLFLDNFFPKISVKPKGHWYPALVEAGPDGALPRQFITCGAEACVSAEREGLVTFARFQVRPHVYPYEVYRGIEIAEGRVGVDVHQPGIYRPRPGHPVIISSAVRFSNNYKSDGTGGAIGTAGLIIWNLPRSDELNRSLYYEAIGLGWTPSSLGPIGGLNYVVAKGDPLPVINIPPVVGLVKPPPFNINKWNVYSFIWTENTDGTQHIYFYINDDAVGEVPLAAPMGVQTGPLSLEIWNDNQVPSPTGTGFPSPTSNQNFDVAYVLAVQL